MGNSHTKALSVLPFWWPHLTWTRSVQPNSPSSLGPWFPPVLLYIIRTSALCQQRQQRHSGNISREFSWRKILRNSWGNFLRKPWGNISGLTLFPLFWSQLIQTFFFLSLYYSSLYLEKILCSGLVSHISEERDFSAMCSPLKTLRYWRCEVN